MDLTTLATQLKGGHEILAILTKQPLFAISDGEAKSLAAAIQNVAKHHKINIDPRLAAYGQLAVVAATIYGPKIYIVMQSRPKKQPKAAQTTMTTFPDDGLTGNSGNTGTMRYQ